MRLPVAAVLALSLVCAHAPLAGAHPASAQPASPEAASAESTARAAEVKKRGDDAIDTGRPADALAAYVEAYGLTKDPALLYNKGRALQGLGEYPQALEELEAFEKAAPPELRARVPGLAKQLSDLRNRVTTVSIACDTMGARVRFRDRSLGKCPLPEKLRIASGRGTLDVLADGYFPYVREVDLAPGGAASLDVHLASMATIKFLMPDALTTHDGVARFEREARAAALLRSPHVVRVLDVDATTDGLPFIVMEYLEGHDLASELRMRNVIPTGEAVDLILAGAAALLEGHRSSRRCPGAGRRASSHAGWLDAIRGRDADGARRGRRTCVAEGSRASLLGRHRARSRPGAVRHTAGGVLRGGGGRRDPRRRRRRSRAAPAARIARCRWRRRRPEPARSWHL